MPTSSLMVGPLVLIISPLMPMQTSSATSYLSMGFCSLSIPASTSTKQATCAIMCGAHARTTLSVWMERIRPSVGTAFELQGVIRLATCHSRSTLDGAASKDASTATRNSSVIRFHTGGASRLVRANAGLLSKTALREKGDIPSSQESICIRRCVFSRSETALCWSERIKPFVSPPGIQQFDLRTDGIAPNLGCESQIQ